MKKILFIHHSGSLGGAGVNVKYIANVLKSKYEVVVYCPTEPKELGKYLRENDINIKEYNFNPGYISYYNGSSNIFSSSFISGLMGIIKNKNKWEEIIEREKPDLILVNSKILSWFSLLTKRKNLKSICYIGETKPNKLISFGNKVQSFLLSKFSGIIYISEYDLKNEKLSKPIQTVVPNYVDKESFIINSENNKIKKNLNLPTTGFNILFVGGMHRIKGFELAIKAFKYLKNYDINLIVAGYSDFIYKSETTLFNRTYNLIKKQYENKINRIINNNKLSNSIHYIGVQENMADIYDISDVLIFPATIPHQARPAFEAGYLKKPAILPDYPNYYEFIKHKYNGLLFKKNSPESLASAIELLINDQELREELGQNNYDFSIANHNSIKSGEKILKFVEKVISLDR